MATKTSDMAGPGRTGRIVEERVDARGQGEDAAGQPMMACEPNSAMALTNAIAPEAAAPPAAR
jgi:hypothetical protein